MKSLNRKSLKGLGLLVFTVLMMSGCQVHTSKSFTYNVETGDQVVVQLDTTDGYDLIDEGNTFKIVKDDKDLSHGLFLTEPTYKQIMSEVETLKVKETVNLKNNSCTYYETDSATNREYDYICWIKGSDTGFAIASKKSKTEAQTVFGYLDISKK